MTWAGMHFSIGRLVLVRHGETDWNRGGRFQGATDVPLNAAGIEQARLLAERLRATPADAIYTSPLVRAAATADAVSTAVGRPARRDPRLRERDLGAWGGLTLAEVRERHLSEWERTLAGEDLPIGGGETKADAQRRMLEAVESIGREHSGGTVVVVSHGMAIKSLVCGLIGLDLALSERIATPANASVTEIEGRRGAPRLVVLGDASHLAAVRSA